MAGISANDSQGLLWHTATASANAAIAVPCRVMVVANSSLAAASSWAIFDAATQTGTAKFSISNAINTSHSYNLQPGGLRFTVGVSFTLVGTTGTLMIGYIAEN